MQCLPRATRGLISDEAMLLLKAQFLQHKVSSDGDLVGNQITEMLAGLRRPDLS
jgi:hypothetical protein